MQRRGVAPPAPGLATWALARRLGRLFTRSAALRSRLVSPRLLLPLALVGLAACSDPAPTARAAADAAPVIRWTLVSTAPKNLPGPGTGVERFASDVAAMSAGRLQIRVHGAGELVGAFEVFDAVVGGDAQLGHGAAYYWRGKIPEAAFFAAVPFGMTAQETNAWLYHGGGLELWQELYAPFGVVPFPAGNSGAQMGGWFDRPVDSLEDLAGLKMRILGLGGEVFERAGGIAVSLPADAVFTAMQTGVLDAVEWVGPWNDQAFGLHRLARYYYHPGWQEPGPPLEMIVNADAWAALPADLRAIVQAALRAMNEDMLAEYTARNNAALEDLVERHGVEVRRFPDDVLQRLRVLSDQVVDEMGERSPMAGRIHDSYRDFQRGVSAWHAVSEHAYLRAREETER